MIDACSPKVSLLIAVHNVEAYLKDCLNSLLYQTMEDWEAICVDDFSTDNSFRLLQEFATKDKRIKVYKNSENKGIGYTRNVALGKAMGEYIMMLDGDDCISPNALMDSVSVLDRHPLADIVVLKLIFWNSWSMKGEEDKEFPYHPLYSVLTGKQAFRLCLNWQLHGIFLIRARLHKQYPYDESAILYSDDNTPRIHYLHARNVLFSNGKYYYRQYLNSSTHQISIRRFDYLIANLSLKKDLEKESSIIDNDALNDFEVHRWLNWLSHCRLFIKNKSKFSSQEKMAINKILKECLLSMEFFRVPFLLRCKLGNWTFYDFKGQIFQQKFYLFLQNIWHQIKSITIHQKGKC